MKTIYKAAAIASILTAPAFALFGVADWVEPGVGFQIQFAKDVAQALQLYTVTKDALSFFKQKNRWQGQASQIVNTVAGNQSGAMGGWAGAVGTGTGVAGVWRGATMPIPTTLPVSNRSIQTDMASIEAVDAAAQTALMTHGRSLTNLTQLAGIITNFKQTLFDTSAGTNSQVQQLNLLNAGQSQHMDLDQNRAQIEAAQLQLSAASAMQARNDLAGKLQYQADLTQEGTAQNYSLGTYAGTGKLSYIPK